jgi:hypothetical protein
MMAPEWAPADRPVGLMVNVCVVISPDELPVGGVQESHSGVAVIV